MKVVVSELLQIGDSQNWGDGVGQRAIYADVYCRHIALTIQNS
jgi:hypothetical protein